jgi:fumarate hydratase class II
MLVTALNPLIGYDAAAAVAKEAFASGRTPCARWCWSGSCSTHATLDRALDPERMTRGAGPRAG